GDAGRDGPYRTKVFHVLGIDLIERTVPPAVVRAPIQEPVAGLRVHEPLVGDDAVVGDLRSGEERNEHERAGGAHSDGGHHATPPSEPSGPARRPDLSFSSQI